VYFYRDQHGVEADLLIEHADELTVLEVKAGQTATADLLSPAQRIGETLATVKKTRVMAVYGGDRAQERSGVRLVPWSQLDASLV
jgi:hypothetical protein